MTVQDGVQQKISQRPAGFGEVRCFFQRDGHSLPDFNPAAVIARKHIPGSNRTVTQMMGLLPKTVTHTLHFANAADYRLFESYLSTTQNYIINRNAATELAPERWVNSEAFVRIPDVRLMSISDKVTFITGRVRCTATFAIDDV